VYYVYDSGGNLIAQTDEDGYVTEYSYSPTNLISEMRYTDGKIATFI